MCVHVCVCVFLCVYVCAHVSLCMYVLVFVCGVLVYGTLYDKTRFVVYKI